RLRPIPAIHGGPGAGRVRRRGRQRRAGLDDLERSRAVHRGGARTAAGRFARDAGAEPERVALMRSAAWMLARRLAAYAVDVTLLAAVLIPLTFLVQAVTGYRAETGPAIW